MPFDHSIDLFRVDEHAAYLGGLIGTTHPALDTLVGAATGAPGPG
jgi:hypothetical protein